MLPGEDSDARHRRAIHDHASGLIDLIDSDLMLTGTLIEIERLARSSGSPEHARETRERILKAFAGLTMLLKRANAMHIDVAARCERLQALKMQLGSGA